MMKITVNLFEKYRPFLVINVALPYQDLTIMEACLKTYVHYLDTANYEPLKKLNMGIIGSGLTRKGLKAGLMALLGVVLIQVTSIFTAYAAKHVLMNYII